FRIKKIEVRRRARLKEVNDAPCFGREMESVQYSLALHCTRRRFRAAKIAPQKRAQRDCAEGRAAAREERPASEGLFDFALKNHGAGRFISMLIRALSNAGWKVGAAQRR